jgi:hypothetical protein
VHDGEATCVGSSPSLTDHYDRIDMKWIFNKFLDRAGETTTWLGAIGIALAMLHMTGVIFWLCVGMLFIPDNKLNAMFAEWTAKLRNIH